MNLVTSYANTLITRSHKKNLRKEEDNLIDTPKLLDLLIQFSPNILREKQVLVIVDDDFMQAEAVFVNTRSGIPNPKSSSSWNTCI